MRLTPWLYAEPRPALRHAMVGACIVTAVAIAFADYELGLEISLVGAYVLPVGAAAWYGEAAAGYLTTAAAAAGLFAADRIGGTQYSSALFAYWDSAINAFTLAVLAALISIIRRQLRYERRVARSDSLTGLRSARALREAIAEEALRCHRFGHPFALVYIDLDGLKTVNDSRGHGAGDHLLRLFARRLQGAVRWVDRAGRLGGDEFGLVLPESRAEDAMDLLARLKDRDRPGGSGAAFSAGVVVFEDVTDDVGDRPAFTQDAIDAADDAMYAARNCGRGCVVVRHWRNGELRDQPPHTPLRRAAAATGDSDPLAARMLHLSE